MTELIIKTLAIKLLYLCCESNVGLALKNRTSLDNPVILAVESFKVTSYKFRFSGETMFILPSNDFLLEFSDSFYRQTNNRYISKLRPLCYLSPEATIDIIEASIKHPCPFLSKNVKNLRKIK